MKLTAAVTHEDPWYVARCLEVEVTSQGKRSEEALENLKDALELYFEDVERPEGSPTLSALAGSNEVLVSSTVKDLVAGSGIEFDSLE